MDQERWRQIEELYHAVLEQEPSQRAVFLAGACAEDSGLRREVEMLLAQSAATETMADQSAWAAAGELAATRTILNAGEKLGPYEIVGLLGAGGMGEVYSALDTRLDRKVAVKVCRDGSAGALSAKLA